MTLCSFCQASPACVLVPLPSLKKKNRTIPTAFCLLHYYTTSAVRVGGVIAPDNTTSNHHNSTNTTSAGTTETSSNANNSNKPNRGGAGVKVINAKALQEQLPAQQELFAEAFVQLREELQEASIRQFSAHKNDPLAILNQLNETSSRKNKRGASFFASNKAPKKRRDAAEQNAGGFLRDIPVPERLIKTQQQQLRQQQELTARMQRAASASATANTVGTSRCSKDTTQRRKPTRKSIWNVMLEDDNDDDRKPSPVNLPSLTDSINNTGTDNDKICTCGSHQVEVLSSNASNRNQDMAKAETWGNKDRGGEIITRYRCTSCGKTWNEEE